MRRFLNEILPEQAVRRIEILSDNEISFTLIKDPKSQNRIKHIDMKHYHVRRLVDKRELGIEWIFSPLILANGLLKALPAAAFKKHHN